MSEKKAEVITMKIAEEKNEMIIELVNTYDFEGEKINKIDMSGLEDITANDMIKANKVLTASGGVSMMPETNLEYCLIIAAGVTGRPVEFFKSMKPHDAIKIKNAVTNFFFGEE